MVLMDLPRCSHSHVKLNHRGWSATSVGCATDLLVADSDRLHNVCTSEECPSQAQSHSGHSLAALSIVDRYLELIDELRKDHITIHDKLYREVFFAE